MKWFQEEDPVAEMHLYWSEKLKNLKDQIIKRVTVLGSNVRTYMLTGFNIGKCNTILDNPDRFEKEYMDSLHDAHKDP